VLNVLIIIIFASCPSLLNSFLGNHKYLQFP